MKVSAVVIVYNEEKYIAGCLESLVNQTEKPDEIIVVDNNCTDNTIEIAKKFARVRIVKEKKQGMIYARNTGFDSAKYDLIVRCDADARVPKDWIKKIKKEFKNKKIDALNGPIIFDGLPYPEILKLISDFHNTAGRSMYTHELLNGPNMSLTKKIWKKVKGKVCLLDRDVHEDMDLAIHINQVGGKIGFSKDLAINVSGRRMKNNPVSFFGEYPWRILKTRYKHSFLVKK